MNLPFELFIAVRYLLARRKQAFISLISLISVLGVSVGVMALLIALALMTGLQGELRDRIIGSAREKTVTQLGGAMRKGSAEALSRGADEVPAILIGTDLAQSLEVNVG